ncbi:hypothetical protein DV872_05775 [Oceanispirochaeta sp. M1]|nr:hypothetical protein DV872_05775 [Oceanispirochaeta sp. M1]
MLTELQNRGVQDISTACVDGLTDFPETINTVFQKKHYSVVLPIWSGIH